ncbi:hypothetical protein M404DRAFT_33859 [Pisolithus tinctorius Marx 270]|uniref:Uncharacterized protein n=1 Tax=Pisolithus tinctorius Marx 270 TaxID=870435 RepID=A0A0C3IFJ7_PISTI|nr:hypothetical protein M404DRAFT_33859 [Pisolithus tinctorius Marx 270]
MAVARGLGIICRLHRVQQPTRQPKGNSQPLPCLPGGLRDFVHRKGNVAPEETTRHTSHANRPKVNSNQALQWTFNHVSRLLNVTLTNSTNPFLLRLHPLRAPTQNIEPSEQSMLKYLFQMTSRPTQRRRTPNRSSADSDPLLEYRCDPLYFMTAQADSHRSPPRSGPESLPEEELDLQRNCATSTPPTNPIIVFNSFAITDTVSHIPHE